MSEDVVVVPDAQPLTDVVVSAGATEIVTVVEEGGPPGPRGPVGPVGPQGLTGQGVLVLNVDDPVPPDTAPNTVIFRKEPG